MPPLSSLLTFETPLGRSAVPPPSAHLLVTSMYPAPSSLLPLHYARVMLTGTGRATVIWIGCDGSGESHHRSALKKNGVNASKAAFVYVDALNDVLGQHESSQSAGLDRLSARVEAQLAAVSSRREDNEEEEACLVVLDDASALAWSISALDSAAAGEDPLEDNRVDHRLQVLRSKRRGAIHSDKVGVGLADWIENRLRRSCEMHSAALLTHLTAESTTIIPPTPHTGPTRGGSYGVGTGFDADDAGEEKEDEELYEDVSESWHDVPSKVEDKHTRRSNDGAGRSSTDWRVDSLLRKLLLTADLWVEARGLRSGKARDCHGEICIHALFRPCMAQQQALPNLPLPSDPLRSLRSRDRIARPLANLSNLSLSSASAHSMLPPSRRWRMDIPCAGRENAMLFRAEAVGEAVAWRRGSGTGS